MWNAEDKRYIDYLLAYGPIVLGHCHRQVNAAVSRAVATCDLNWVGPQLCNTQRAEAWRRGMLEAGILEPPFALTDRGLCKAAAHLPELRIVAINKACSPGSDEGPNLLRSGHSGGKIHGQNRPNIAAN